MTELGRDVERLLIKREHSLTKNESLRNDSANSNGLTSVTLKNQASAPFRKKPFEFTKQSKRGQPKQVYEGRGMSDRVNSLGKVKNARYYSGVRLGFVQPIQNGQRMIKKLIKSRPTRAEIYLTGREKMRLKLLKEE